MLLPSNLKEISICICNQMVLEPMRNSLPHKKLSGAIMLEWWISMCI
uniref:Uncharacterized protein n=1 Tax=Rhizophora mucronata TaxID=61149 RepID=A0A2P2PYJ7_RHIMU